MSGVRSNRYEDDQRLSKEDKIIRKESDRGGCPE